MTHPSDAQIRKDYEHAEKAWSEHKDNCPQCKYSTLNRCEVGPQLRQAHVAAYRKLAYLEADS